jgi:transglutaminase-like putative cysteine protease
MRLRVRHSTTYDYDSPITEGYTELRLKPLDSGGQRCLLLEEQNSGLKI